MTVIGEAYIDVKGKTDDFDNDVTGKVGSIAKKAAAIFAGAFALDKVKDFISGSISAASDLNESQSKVGVVFGKQADDIERWASTAAKAMGQSKQQALEAAGTYGNLFTALGITGEKAAGMSTKLVGLAGDLASFNNVSPTEALDALRSGLTGETEPLKRFGVNMNDATLHAEALKLGLISNIKDALDPSVKAQAAYSLILAQTTTAQGDFQRTSSGLANQQRIVSAQFEDLKAKIGTALLPVMLKITGLVSEGLTPALDYLGGVVHDIIGGWTKWNVVMVDGGKSLGPIAEMARTLHQGILALIEAFKGGGVTSDGFVGTMERLGVVLKEVYDTALHPLFAFIEDHAQPILITLAIAIAALVAPFATLAAGLIFLYVKFEVVRDIVDAVGEGIMTFIKGPAKLLNDNAEFLQKNWSDFSEAFGHIMVVIRDIATPIIQALGAIWHAVSDDIFNYVERVWNAILGIIHGIMEQIQGVIQVFTALINGDWGKAWDGVKLIFKGVWDEIYAILSGVLGIIESVLGAFFSVFSVAWKNGWDGILNFLASIWDKIYGVFEAGFNWITDHWKILLGVLLTIVTGGLDLVVAAIVMNLDSIVGFFEKLPGRILGVLGDVASWLLDTGVQIVYGLLTGLGNATKELMGWFIALPIVILAAVAAANIWLLETGKSLLLGLLDGIVAAAPKIMQWYVDLPGRILNWVGDLSRLLWNVGTSIVGGMVGAFEQGVASVASWLSQLPGRMLNWLGDLGRLLWGAGTAMIGGMVGAFEAGVSSVASWLSQLPGRMLHWLGDIGGLLVGIAGNAVRGMAAGLESGVGAVANFMATLPGRMWNWIGDAANALHGIGWNLIWGLAQGIVEFAPHLIQTIKDWVTDKIPDFIKDRLHISSPSKVMMGLGRNIVQGLAIGLSDAGSVAAASARLAAAADLSGLGSFGSGFGSSISASSTVFGRGAVQVSVDARGSGLDSPSVAAMREQVIAGVVEAMEKVDRKTEAASL